MALKKIIVSVINDLVTDQRVHKVCTYLHDTGFDVLLIGRKLPDSPEMDERPYKSKRMKLLFKKGPAFYAEYNIRLFLFLLIHKSNILLSNDLDTLLPNFLIHKIRKTPIVYDSHEYFTETPELVNRPFVQSVWKRIEKTIFPKLENIFTVNDSIAGLFEKDYGIRPLVVRNIPPIRKRDQNLSREQYKLPENKTILILQGAGINIQRGAEELVQAMQYLENCLLLIIGSGDVLGILKDMVQELKLQEKVAFIPRQKPEKLFQYTCLADIGFSIDKDTNLNYRFSLPNKLFDYVHAGVAVITTPLPEIKRIVDEYQIGCFIQNHKPEHIASVVQNLLDHPQILNTYKENCIKAAQGLHWETEKKQLDKIYLKLL